MGENRHCPPSHLDSVTRYSGDRTEQEEPGGSARTPQEASEGRHGAHLFTLQQLGHLGDQILGSGFSDGLASHHARRRGPRARAARPHGAPLGGLAGLGSAAPHHRSSCPRSTRARRNRVRRTARPACRAPACRHGRPAGSPRCAPSRSAGDAETAAALAPPRGEDRPAGPRSHPETEAVGLRPAAGIRLVRALPLGHRQFPCERKAGCPPAEEGSIRKHPRMEGLTRESASRGRQCLALWKNPVL